MATITFAKINIRVRDIEASVAYVRDVLGAEVVKDRTTNPNWVDIAVVRLGGLTIEIVAPTRADSPLAQVIEQRGEGLDSIGFRSDAIGETVVELQGRGARVVSPMGGISWIHPKNPLSLSLELLPAQGAGDFVPGG